jgi:hypothetical protein
VNGQPKPEEAARALAGIRRQQEQVINAVLVPRWYWSAVAAAMVAIGAATDSHRTVVLAVVIPVAVIALVAMTGAMIFGAYRGRRSAASCSASAARCTSSSSSGWWSG